jgi:hypothetical protein
LNVYVQRAGGCDLDDAVVFAEEFIACCQKSISHKNMPSEPSRRTMNLALAFLQLKYPFQCCQNLKQRCDDCPMIPLDVKEKT